MDKEGVEISNPTYTQTSHLKPILTFWVKFFHADIQALDPSDIFQLQEGSKWYKEVLC